MCLSTRESQDKLMATTVVIDEQIDPNAQPDGTSTTSEKHHYRKARTGRRTTTFICVDGNNHVLMVSPGVYRGDTGGFVLDSGAAVHVTGDFSKLSSLHAVLDGAVVRVANGHTLPVVGSGSVILESYRLNGVLYVPGVTRDLVSVSKLTELDYRVEFFGAQCTIRDTRPGAGDTLVGEGRRRNGVYELDWLDIPLDRSPSVRPPTGSTGIN